MAKPQQSAKLLVDKEHEDFIADIPGGQVGAIAVAEQVSEMLRDENIPPWQHFKAILSRAKHLSASRDGRGRDDIVEVNRAQKDPRLPPEYGMAPRLNGELEKADAAEEDLREPRTI